MSRSGWLLRHIDLALKSVNWLRGVDLNHRPLGYEPNRVSDSITFQRLDAAGNDTKSLKSHRSTVIGPQSDYSSARHSVQGSES